MLLCCFWPQVDEDEPNEARQLRKAGRVKKEKKWRRKKKERGGEEEQVGKLVEVQEEGGVEERQVVEEAKEKVLEEEEEEEVIMEVKDEDQQEAHDPEEMKEEEKQEEQDVEEEMKVEDNEKMEKDILLEEVNVETAVVEEEKIQLQKVMEELKDKKKGKKKFRTVVVVIMERKKEEKQQVQDVEEEVKVMETVEVLEEEVSVESPAVVEEVSVESPSVVEKPKAELETIRDRTEEKMLLEEEEKDCVAADLLYLPVWEGSSDAASAEAELIQQLLEELLQEAVMKSTFTASDENVEQQLQEPIDSSSSTVAQTDHCRTQIKTEWATKFKEEQEVSLALVTPDHSTCTDNRPKRSAAEPACESLDDEFDLDCASVMERKWLKRFRERDEQLRWSDDVHDVQTPVHHVEEQVCSISRATTDNIRLITVRINDLLLNTAPHSTLIRLDKRETNTNKVPFHHSVSVRLQDCKVRMLRMKMMRKRTWSERLAELNETLPVVHPLTSHPISLIEPLQKCISSANKHLREGNEMKLSGQTTTTLTSVYIPERSELLLDSMRTPEEQEEVKTIRASSDNNVTDQHQEYEVQILTMKVNWGRKSREKTLRGGLFFMLPKLEVQFMHDALFSDQEEIE